MDDEDENVVKVGGKKIMKITTRFRRVLFSDWNFQRHYRFQLLSLATLSIGSFMLGYQIPLFFYKTKLPLLIGQGLLVTILIYLIWKLQKEDEKLRRLDAMVQGLNTQHTTDKILGEEEKPLRERLKETQKKNKNMMKKLQQAKRKNSKNNTTDDSP